jgi:hypothetical protein
MKYTTIATYAALMGSMQATAICTPNPPPVTPAGTCKCLPTDACWPSTQTWSKFNSTVGNRLVASTPIGSPCHDPTYDAAACDALQKGWTNPLTQ